jgi:thiosulfate reductase cytochrome b subunit
MYLNASMCNYAIFQDREVQKLNNSKILIYRGIMTVLLPLTVILIIDHTYFVFTQHIILRTKKV